ncbi:MAG: ABC transporter ATP-binding protein [Oscillospiraceae bacterium]|nr:ABC transporter ATP-binding protein [Oscillospiraceae bacterium]
MEIVRCEGVTKVYGVGDTQVTAVDDVSLAIEKGEFAAIIGPSGSGKSTLLHLIGAVDRSSEGSIQLDGQEITGMSATQTALLRRRKVGMIYQFYNLIPTLTVKENILLPLRLDKRKEDSALLSQITDVLRITTLMDRLPGQLSGGQQQRVAIARALLYRPAVLLADEPTGNLDQQQSDEIIELFGQANREFEQTILLVTHNEPLARRADRILRMKDGRMDT